MTAVNHQTGKSPAVKMGQGLKWLEMKGNHLFSSPLPTVDVEIAPGEEGAHAFFSEVSRIEQISFCANEGIDHYPEVVNARMHPPDIPAEALARRAHLQSVIQGMEAFGNSLEPAPLRELCAAIAGRAVLDVEALVAMLAAADLVEEAADLLRAARRDGVDVEANRILASQIAPLAAKARLRRTASWQLDTRRSLIRLQYAKEGAALGFDDGDLHVIFLHAFRLEGLRLALDLGKRPRPILAIALPLPVGVGGQAECLDAVLKREPEEDPADLVARLNRRLPAGLQVHQWSPLPTYASGLVELALKSHWRWVPSEEDRTQAEARISAFLSSDTWPWDRGGVKADEPLDLRHILGDLRWEDGALCFSTRMGAFHALNPLKVLAEIFQRDTLPSTGLVRVAVELRPDARLGQAERFEAKLKNMYEDAVLLSGGSNIVLVDEDDDEPIRLGPPPEPT